MLKLDKSQITRNLGKKYKLVPYLEKGLADFDEPWEYTYEEKEKDTAWHPSSHCTPPVSDLYEIAQGADSFGPISGSLRKSFQVGHFWHQLLQYIAWHKLELCTFDAIERKEVKSWGDGPYHSVMGSADIAPLEAPNWSGGVDFKTMSSQQFKQASIPEWAAAKYECQVQIYMDLFDEDEWIILPINKDTPHDFREHLYSRNDDLISMIYEKWKFVSACLDAGEAPTKMDDNMFPIEDLLTGPIAS